MPSSQPDNISPSSNQECGVGDLKQTFEQSFVSDGFVKSLPTVKEVEQPGNRHTT
jgi:hypothetical protein